MSFFITTDREQLCFKELDIEELISEDHPVRFFWQACEKLKLARLYQDYKIIKVGKGLPANDPRVLLCL